MTAHIHPRSIFLAIYFGGYEPPLSSPESLPICSRMPDSSTKYKLQCPKCDAFEEGKCMIFVPYSSQQTSINAKGTNCTHHIPSCMITHQGEDGTLNNLDGNWMKITR